MVISVAAIEPPRLISMSRWRQAGLVLAVFLASRGVIFAAAAFSAASNLHGALSISQICQWDCGWYEWMVDHGYQAAPDERPSGQVDWAFFPLSPLLARIVAGVTGLPAAFALVVSSNLAMLGGLFLLHEYCRRTRNDRFAADVVLLASFSPFGIYCALGYTEGLFLLLTTGAFLLWREDRFLCAGLLGGMASATRSVGVLLGLAFLVTPQVSGLLMRRDGLRNERTARLLLGLALVPLGLAAFMAYLYALTGDALAFAHAQIAWSQPSGGFLLVLHQLKSFEAVGILGVCAIATGGALGVYQILNRHFMEGIFLLAAGFLVIFLRVILGEGVYSAPRYVFGCFPIYIAIAALLVRAGIPRWTYLPPMIAAQALYMWDWVKGEEFLV